MPTTPVQTQTQTQTQTPSEHENRKRRKRAFPFPAILFSAVARVIGTFTNKYKRKHKHKHKHKHKQQQQRQQRDHRRPGTSLSPLHIPPLVMGKLKKSKASPAAASATPAPQDEAILDDLFAQLDAQQETKNKPPSGKALGGGANPSTSSSDKKITMNGAMSSAKARFKIREVGLHLFSLHSRSHPHPPLFLTFLQEDVYIY